ncbi:protein MHF1 homolog isoform X3 [Lactuca sativa]|uniref:protein MHF1 homolog isoform X3 n=1 Tax=Lactuca sativa TaxID=4236 RepID=UPI001C690070|nr:protein MHF1 homolog isoform X3 [Lactuca sativa]
MDPITMEGGYNGSDEEKEDVEETTSHLRDRFRLSTISIAESEAKQDNMEISQPVIVCISDLAFKYAVVFSVTAEQLAEDLEMFAHHAGRKSVNMNDVIISVCFQHIEIRIWQIY